MWFRDRILLENRKLLALEGYNNKFGWHAYLCYGKEKMDNFFKNNCIRRNILGVWTKYKKY